VIGFSTLMTHSKLLDNNNEIIPVEDEYLPVILPDAKEFMPTGQSPLTLDKEFLYFDHPKIFILIIIFS